MNEPTIDASEQVIEQGSADELARLRTTNGSLLATLKARKARIETLETETANLQTKLTTAETNVFELTIAGPMKTMAASLSKAPSAFLAEFQKSYRVELQDGKLTLLHKADGKPVMGKDDKPVPFEREALLKLLSTTEGDAKLLYDSILIVGRATGGAGRTATLPIRSSQSADDGEKKELPMQFGLR